MSSRRRWLLSRWRWRRVGDSNDGGDHDAESGWGGDEQLAGGRRWRRQRRGRRGEIQSGPHSALFVTCCGGSSSCSARRLSSTSRLVRVPTATRGALRKSMFQAVSLASSLRRRGWWGEPLQYGAHGRPRRGFEAFEGYDCRVGGSGEGRRGSCSLLWLRSAYYARRGTAKSLLKACSVYV